MFLTEQSSINQLINNNMSHMNTTLLKISYRKYNKCYSELTSDERSTVLNIYYDFY